MRVIRASEFKAKCLEVLDEVAKSHEPVLITKNGKPVAELRPARRAGKSIWGLHKGQIEMLGDIVEALDVKWEANR